jgi:site-specific recombinase XerD
MIISQHKESGLWYFTVPAKMSDTGRRKPMYFPTKHKAEDGLADFQREYRKYRGSTLSEKDHGVMAVIKAKYPDLNVIAVLEAHKRSHGNLNPISVRDATEAYIKRIQASTLADDTKSGYRSRLRQFATFIGDHHLHEVTADQIDRFLQTRNEGGDRRTHWKGLSPFFKHAVNPARWVLKNPMDDFSKEQKPKWGESKREIYTPEQYGKLLEAAAKTDEYVTRYLVLAGMGFFRPEELIRASAKDEVLVWEDFQLDRELIHVRKEVAKGTGRRGGDERYVELKENQTLLKWLREETSGNQLTGEILPFSNDHIYARINKVHAMAGVDTIPDGLRHSAISYYLAMYSGTTIRQVGQWAGNSEATILTYYLRYLRPEAGEAWFHEVDQLIRA